MQVAPVEPAHERGDPRAQEHGCAQRDERHRTPDAPKRETRVRAVGEGLQQGAERRRVVERMGADGNGDADHHEDGEVEAVTPPDERGREQRQRRDGVADHDERAALRVVDAGFDPVAELVAPVEEPVAEPAQHLGRDARGGDGLDRLGVLEDVDAVAALGPQAGDPPQRRAQGEHTDASQGQRSSSPIDLSDDQHRVRNPQQRREEREHERGRVHAPDDLHDDGERGGISPPALAQRAHHQRQQPSQRGPREQDHRDTGRVVQGVRAQHVREGGDDRARAAHVDRAEQVQDAEPGEEHDAAEPDALSDPAREAHVLHDPVVRAHREQVADVLVRDRAEADVRVPHRRRALEQTRRVQVQVLLGVGGDLARRREQRRDVRQRGEERIPEDPPPAR